MVSQKPARISGVAFSNMRAKSMRQPDFHFASGTARRSGRTEQVPFKWQKRRFDVSAKRDKNGSITVFFKDLVVNAVGLDVGKTCVEHGDQIRILAQLCGKAIGLRVDNVTDDLQRKALGLNGVAGNGVILDRKSVV